MKSIARWETKGNDWLELFDAGPVPPQFQNETKSLRSYFYKGNGCGGGFSAEDAAAAIAQMEAPWGDPRGTGQVTVLKSDRPSTKRVR